MASTAAASTRQQGLWRTSGNTDRRGSNKGFYGQKMDGVGLEVAHMATTTAAATMTGAWWMRSNQQLCSDKILKKYIGVLVLKLFAPLLESTQTKCRQHHQQPLDKVHALGLGLAVRIAPV